MSDNSIPRGNPTLPEEWRRALQGRRTMHHYKPAALLTVLDMIEDGSASEGSFALDDFERRFESRLRPFDPQGSRRGWEPFLHLSYGDHVWALYRGSSKSVVPEFKPNRSRSYLLSYADRAVFDPLLFEFVKKDTGRRVVRAAIYQMLSEDAAPKSRELLRREAPEFATTQPPASSALNFEIGKTYDRQRDIHGPFGGQAQGGICTPTNFPVIFLFTGDSGHGYGYRDSWTPDGEFLYTGEGQKGDMEFVRGNKAIRDHTVNGKDVLLFESLGKSKGYRYLGPFQCASWEVRQNPDEDSRERKAIVFHLVPDTGFAVGPTPQDVPDEGANLEELRRRALEAARPAPQLVERESKASYRERSEAVRRYVLARAAGKCEACERPAPFRRPDGSPYLEAHHTRRLSDDGPDDPMWVAGICPTCHREIHHGVDGRALNLKLQALIRSKEREA